MEKKREENEERWRRERKIGEIVFCQTYEHDKAHVCSTFNVIQVKAERCFDSVSYHTVAQIDVEMARKKGETAVM